SPGRAARRDERPASGAAACPHPFAIMNKQATLWAGILVLGGLAGGLGWWSLGSAPTAVSPAAASGFAPAARGGSPPGAAASSDELDVPDAPRERTALLSTDAGEDGESASKASAVEDGLELRVVTGKDKRPVAGAQVLFARAPSTQGGS